MKLFKNILNEIPILLPILFQNVNYNVIFITEYYQRQHKKVKMFMTSRGKKRQECKNIINSW